MQVGADVRRVQTGLRTVHVAVILAATA